MKLSTNRVVLILHAIFVIATAAVVFVTAIQGSLPTAWGPSIAFGVSIVSAVAGGTVAVTKFLQGSQNVDQQNHEVRLLQMKHENTAAVMGNVKVASTPPPNTGQVEPVRGATQNSLFALPDDEPDTEEGPPFVEEVLDSNQWLSNRKNYVEPENGMETEPTP